jgi:hypothetical protein
MTFVFIIGVGEQVRRDEQEHFSRASLNRADRLLNKVRALGRAATARKLSLVMGFSVVAGEFLARLDISLGVELCASISDPHKNIGRAGVIHKFKWPSADAAINRLRTT